MNRENRFVVLARFCKEKKLHVAIEILRKLIAPIPDAKATIIGAVTSRSILEELRQMSRLYQVDDHVTFEPDLDLESVREVLGRSKVIFSTMPNEPFGTAIVEGMAAGCVPLVQKGGGQYEDIIERDKFGLSYEDENKAAHFMESIMLHDQERLDLKRLSIGRATSFSVHRFREKLEKTIFT